MSSLPHINLRLRFKVALYESPLYSQANCKLRNNNKKRQISYTAELTYTSLPAIKIAQLTIAFSKDT